MGREDRKKMFDVHFCCDCTLNSVLEGVDVNLPMNSVGMLAKEASKIFKFLDLHDVFC